jgi:hypothetical protein
MASRMPAARLQGRIINADEYEKDMHGAVQCLDCGCAVLGVRSYPRTVGDHEIVVRAYFRLPTDAQKDGKGHEPGCRFNIGSAVSVLVARSAEVKTFSSEAEPLLSALLGKQTELRLHILTEIVQPRPSGYSEDGFDKEIPPSSLGRRYITSQRLLSAYLRAAESLLSLVGWVQKRRDLSEWIVLRHGSHHVRWNRFFFDLEDYRQLYDQLAGLEAGQKAAHPVAIVIELGNQSLGKMTKYGSWPLRGRNPTPKSEELAICPTLFVRDEKLAHKMLKERLVLVCAVPKLGRRRDAPKPWLKPEVELQLTVNHRAQFCGFTPT